MSTSARASTRGGTKNSKQQNENHKNTDSVKSSAGKENKTHKNDAAGNKSNKNNSAGEKKTSTKAPPVPTAEQLRLARLITSKPGAGSGGDAGDQDLFQAKVQQVMDLTRKSEEAVCAALAENDEDVNRAVEVLLESDDFEFTSVKKKNKKTVSSKGESGGKDKGGDGGEDLNHVNASNGGGGNFERRGRGRGRGGGTTDRGGRPYRSRENKENENSGGYRGGNDEFSTGGERGRRGGGPGARYGDRPPRGGRGGGRGGGAGPRTYSRQGGQDRGDGFPKSIDTWNNPPGAGEDSAAASGKMETWGEFPSPEDWDNEEYTGSLADSKVFTPSSATDALAPPPGLEDTHQVPPTSLLGVVTPTDPLNTSFQSASGEPPVDAASTGTTTQANTSGGEELRPQSPVSMSATLTAAQSQYLSQLTQQAQSQQVASTPSYAAVSSPPTPAYTTGTEFVNSYSTTLNDIGNTQQVLPQRSKAPRTRVPPPSKIPATAVEMPPGDTSSIDVQFGALDFGTEPAAVSFGAPDSSAPVTEPGAGVGGGGTQQQQQQQTAKYASQATDPIAEHAYVNSTSLAAAASQLKNNHSLTSSLVKSSGPESILGADNYSASRNTTFQELASMASKAAQDSYETSSFPQPSNSLYQSSKTSVASSTYPPSSTPYASQAYSSTNANVYSSSSNTGGGYPSSMSNGGGSYSTSSQYNNSSYVPSAYPGAYSTPSYQQQGSTGTTGYGGNAASQQSSQQQQQQQSYQYNNVGSLGGGNSGSTPYNSYQSSGAASNPLAHKLSSAASALSKDSQYESIPQTGGQGTPVASLNSSNPAGLSSLTQSSMSSSASSASNQKSSGAVSAGPGVSNSNLPSAKSSNVASIPPGVGAPVVGAQYIMSSAGLPYMYNHQPPMYNFEDLQLVPNRIPHGYYDLGFPPTSMGGRGEPSVAAYSAMSDARFARTDNNASPVPSSLSTQNATQAPLMNPPLPYAYYYSSIPSNPFSYSTPLYPQVNAGGYASTAPASGGGSGGGKSSVGGAGGAGGVSQVTGGVGGPNASPQQGGGSASSADLMYSKSQHASLAKVNSYDKATFHHHTGTPPPYSLPGVGSVGGGMAQHSYAPVIVPGSQPPHHNTTLMHQPHLQDSSGNSTSRSQAGSQVNKTSSKPYYGNWNQN